MFPILFTIGTVSLYSTSLMTVLAWLVFSFLFWRGLRAQGATEDHIFDLTFYATIVAFVAARAGYIVTHWDVFAGKSSLLMLALWVAPGLSWLCGNSGVTHSNTFFISVLVSPTETPPIAIPSVSSEHINWADRLRKSS